MSTETSPTRASAPSSQESTEKTYMVERIMLGLSQTTPPQLTIWAVGKARTAGYTNARLNQYIYTHAPLDGIWEFSFDAEAPVKDTTDVLQPITSQSFVWVNFPKDLKGIRVHAASNAMDCLLTDATPLVGTWSATSGTGSNRALEVKGEVPTDGKKPQVQLKKSISQGINPTILLLDLDFAGGVDPNSTTLVHVSYSEDQRTENHTSVQVLHQGKNIATFPII